MNCGYTKPCMDFKNFADWGESWYGGLQSHDAVVIISTQMRLNEDEHSEFRRRS